MRIPFGLPANYKPSSPTEQGRLVKEITAKCVKHLNRVTPVRFDAASVTFDLPHCFHRDANPVTNAKVLHLLLEYLTSLDLLILSRNKGKITPLYKSKVIYDRTTIWDTIPNLYRKGFGDCKSLSACKVAELRAQGVAAMPVFRWIRNADGSTDFHILVQTAQGFEDPSKNRGMGKDENAQSPTL